MAGKLSGITDVQVAAWGGVAFFVAREGNGPMGLYSMDLSTGQARPLLGPGGVIPRAREVGRAAVSPVPVTRGPREAPLAL